MFICLPPYKKNSLKSQHCQKLTPKFYGPYTILKWVGPMAYQLSFPNNSKRHPIFRILCLNKVIGTKFYTQTSLPDLDEEGSIWFHSKVLYHQRECHFHQCTTKKFLAQLKDTPVEYTTWEPTTIMQ